MEYFIHDTSIVDKGCLIGQGTKVWHFCHLTAGCRLGEGCSIGQNVYIGGEVVLGNRVKVQNNVSLYDGVVCGDDVFIGPSAVFTNVINPRSFIVRKAEYRPTVIGKGASIGANATIVCGVTLGNFSFIGAGAVVTKDVPSYALMVGNPAQQRGWVGQSGRTLLPNGHEQFRCPETGEQYIVENNSLRPL